MSEQRILKTGYLWKQGGSYKSWKIRYFVLRGNSLLYYKSEGDGSPKGVIDLTAGRGVRAREQCDLEWPDKAKPGRSFGLAVESRTFYLYGEDPAAVGDWMSTIQEIIDKVGKPSTDYSSDARSRQETTMSRVMRSSAKMVSQVAKKLTKQPIEDEGREEVSREHCVTANEARRNTDCADDASGSSVEEVYDDVEVKPFKSEVESRYTGAHRTESGGRGTVETASHENGFEIEEIYELTETSSTGKAHQPVEELEESDSEIEEIYEEN